MVLEEAWVGWGSGRRNSTQGHRTVGVCNPWRSFQHLINCVSKMVQSSRILAISHPKGAENQIHKTNEMQGEERSNFEYSGN